MNEEQLERGNVLTDRMKTLKKKIENFKKMESGDYVFVRFHGFNADLSEQTLNNIKQICIAEMENKLQELEKEFSNL